MIYTSSLKGVTSFRLRGFFAGWPNKPSPRPHLSLLKNCGHIRLAVDKRTDKAIGFITAISDGVLCACIPLLEILPECRNQGIGRELVKRMLQKLKGLYMIDLLCDPGLQPFYQRLGMAKAAAMMIRNYRCQSGRR
ncbi:MAG: GNAT family N-acetyltransferase [Candidatus Edwardsbacteria bacterium]|nr:GNAT family N-acetyltransferase [Candidatus Edwardsbacteria bacterium]